MTGPPAAAAPDCPGPLHVLPGLQELAHHPSARNGDLRQPPPFDARRPSPVRSLHRRGDGGEVAPGHHPGSLFLRNLTELEGVRPHPGRLCQPRRPPHLPPFADRGPSPPVRPMPCAPRRPRAFFPVSYGRNSYRAGPGAPPTGGEKTTRGQQAAPVAAAKRPPGPRAMPAGAPFQCVAPWSRRARTRRTMSQTPSSVGRTSSPERCALSMPTGSTTGPRR